VKVKILTFTPQTTNRKPKMKFEIKLCTENTESNWRIQQTKGELYTIEYSDGFAAPFLCDENGDDGHQIGDADDDLGTALQFERYEDAIAMVGLWMQRVATSES
jgi:hypothetical protein